MEEEGNPGAVFILIIIIFIAVLIFLFVDALKVNEVNNAISGGVVNDGKISNSTIWFFSFLILFLIILLVIIIISIRRALAKSSE
ncbi:MAG: hypothetical protein QW244_02510 [Candidatus Pacearchaeota archaeon]